MSVGFDAAELERFLAESITGTVVTINPDGTPLFMVEFDPALVAWAAGIAMATGLLAAVMPARRAAKLDPVVAIRA